MLQAVSPKLTGSSMNDKNAARVSVALMLYLMAKLCSAQSEDSQLAEQIAQIKEHLKWFLNCWIVRGDVIGGSTFGGGSILHRSGAEIKVSIHYCMYRQIALVHVSAYMSLL